MMATVPRAMVGAALGHALGAVVGALLLAGPASRLSTTTVLVLVHVVADTGAGLGALRGAGAPAGRWPVVAGVVGTGALASAVVLALAGPAPAWLLVRAAVVVVIAGTWAGFWAAAQNPLPPSPRRRGGDGVPGTEPRIRQRQSGRTASRSTRV